MNIYISYDYKENITGILLAESKEKSSLVWMGMRIEVNRVEEIDPNEKNIGMNGVAVLVTSVKRTKFDFRDTSEIITFKRGI